MAIGSLDALLHEATLRVVTHFLLRPHGGLHFRALQRHLGLSVHSLQREIARLERMMLILRHEEYGRVFYAPADGHPSWNAFRTLVREHADPVVVLRDALTDLEWIRAGFVFGSVARGDARPDSNVDLFVVTNDVQHLDFARAVLEAQVLLDREIDVKRVSAERLKEDEARSGFVRDALRGPKKWVVGSAATLRSLRGS
jgi:predicted nucleotidyltransferase